MNSLLRIAKNRVAQNSGLLVIDRVLALLAAILVTALVARHLGPRDFGVLSYARNYYGLFLFLSTLGLENIAIKYLVYRKEASAERQGSVFWAVVTVRLLGSVLSLILGLTVLFLTNPGARERTTAALLLAIPFVHVFTSIEYHLHARQDVRTIFLARTLALVTTSGLKLWAVFSNMGLLHFVVLELFQFVSVVIFLWVLTIRRYPIPSINVARVRRLVFPIVAQAVPLTLSSALISIYTKIDIIMIQNLISTEAVGIYAVASRLSTAWYFVPAAAVTALYPTLITYHKKDSEMFYRKTRVLYSVVSIIGLLAALLVALFATPVVQFLFGEAYLSSVPVLRIHAWSGLFVFSGIVSGRVLVILGSRSTLLWRAALAGALNVVLNLIFIPAYGINGAAVATVFSYLVGGVLGNVVTKAGRRVAFEQLVGYSLVPLRGLRGVLP